jgi:hypothetical protein
MGDISEYRGLITVVTFLGVFALLLTILPGAFMTAANNKTVDVPSGLFETADVYAYAETASFMMNDSAPTLPLDPEICYWEFTLGGHQLQLSYVIPNATSYNYGFYLWHIYYEWWIFPADHKMTFYDGNVDMGTDILATQLTENQIILRAKCSHLFVDVGFAYNDTLYSSFTNAWDHGAVYALFGIEFDQVNTSYNAMGLISNILFFSLPEETPVIIKAIISIPIWVAVGYLVFIFILRTIGAVFGGGGA